MINLTVTDREGEKHEIEAPVDMSMNLMELIRVYELAPEGTIGTCGGMAMCASCQIYILSQNISLPEKSDEEEAMLSEAFFVKDNSRLGCQIFITKEIDGLEFELAPNS